MTSRRLRSLIGQLSFDLVPNMVLAKIKIHEHRTKQTYHNYTFQPLMSFWGDITLQSEIYKQLKALNIIENVEK